MTKRKPGDAAAPKPSPQKKKEIADPVQVFAEKLRDHKGLESRFAVMQENRVEYFRGKDFVALFKDNPDLKKTAGEHHLSQSSEEEIANTLLKRKLILRCERVVKTLRPGKKKLSKWPARLELSTNQNFSEDDAFFAWTFERKRPLWQTVLSIMVPVLTIACCLFPLFPHWCKLAVMYICLAVLAAIIGLLIVRGLVFSFSYLFLGKRIWFFPKILADDASFSELIKFWPEPPKEDEKPPRLTTRLAFALVGCVVVFFCVRHAPDEAARARYQKGVSNIIDEVLEWSPKLALSGKVEEKNTTSTVSSEVGHEGERVEQQTDPFTAGERETEL